MPDTINLPLDKASGDPQSTANDTKKQQTIETALNILAGTLTVKLSKYVSSRYDKEAEWMAAENQYSGNMDVSDNKKLQAMRSLRSKDLPTVNITRPKTNIAIARLQDIQFPLGGDFNFSVEATPMPEMEELQTSEQPMPGEDAGTIGQAAQNTIKAAKDKAARMEATIHDRFIAAKWAKKSRLAMEQMAILGTGVLKAPVLMRNRRKRYKSLTTSIGSTVQDLSIDSSIIPTVQWVDIRMWFPDPSARLGLPPEDSFELHLYTALKLRNLAKDPAFMKNRIQEVLRTEPDSTIIAKSALTSIIGTNTDTLENRYSTLEYHGIIDKRVLLELGLIDQKDVDNPMIIIQGEVWFVNDSIIRVSIAPLEEDDVIPYFSCTWETDQSSLFGHGVPYLMRHAQRVTNSSWLMLLDNAGLTAGPQIVLNKEMIQPANPSEGWEIRPMKVWFMTEYGSNVKDAMQFVNVPTQQEPISNIIEMSLQFADIESSIPSLLQGELPQANNTTFGGLTMVMSATHIIQQKLNERWDDNITVPIVSRFYHYEMQYGEDDSIKGDFDVKAGGATERIDKQVKSQDLERIIGMAGSDPAFMEQVDLGEAFREWVATTRAGNILRPRAEIEAARQKAAQNPEPNPELIEAEARSKQADAAIAKIELDRETGVRDSDLRAQIAEATVDKESREIIARERENRIKLQIAQMAREDMIIKMAADQNITAAELAQKLDIAIMTEETKRLSKQADLDKFNTEIKVKRELGSGI